MRRRTFLALGGGAGATLVLGGAGLLAGCGGGDDPDPGALEGEGGDRPDVDGLAAVGVAYVAATPDEADQSALRQALGLAPDDATEPTTLLAERASEVRADFAAGPTSDRVLLVDGWLLSRTEGRIAGLAAFGTGDLAD